MLMHTSMTNRDKRRHFEASRRAIMTGSTMHASPVPMSLRWSFLQFVAIRWVGTAGPFILFSIRTTPYKTKTGIRRIG